MQNAARDDQVIAAAESYASERRFEYALAFADIHDLIALRVPIEIGNVFDWADDGHGNVVVEEQRGSFE